MEGKWYVRIHNIDEFGRAYVNDELVAEAEHKRDTGWVEITERLLTGQDNLIRFTNWNNTEEYTWGFAIKHEDEIVWEDKQGDLGFKGANDNDLTKTNRLVYDKTIVVSQEGEVFEHESSPHKWFVRVYNVDDQAVAYLNGDRLIEVPYRGDSDWIEISPWVLLGRENTLRFTDWNNGAGGTWGFALRRDGETVWQEEGDSRDSYKYVFDEMLFITRDGGVSVVPESTRWYLRIYYADDRAAITVGGDQVLELKYGQADTGWIEVTKLIEPGKPTYLRFSDWNSGGGAKWIFALKRNNGIIWEEEGSSNDSYQMAYDYLVFITEEGEVSGESPEYRWFIRVWNNDDKGAAYVNGEKIFEEENQTGDWIDITELLSKDKENEVRFTNWNVGGPTNWRFAIRRNNSIVWEDEGKIDKGKENQIVYDKTLILTPQGEVREKE